ncbi:Fe2+-dependent dioxygenase [Roseococcus sp. SYP-B2431]|uniref:Fe2+-dependent dioxygenase n=1 Tax=Roseococcus sp. SYP-B2431 TaxID=2496640 RepID=UPI0010390FC4|nr:Fe2+-dependent dioxygenase [Roseococcus sp. SYP-B2431]TCH99880.1 Fe2+-dependent dioxygenase [Roseococcus sp. SYP-B2431]
MILCLAQILDTERRARIDALLAAAEFVDGAQTAGWHARLVKANRQASPGHPAAREAAALVSAALRDHAVFRSAVLPRRIAPPLFARYGGGESYGTHVDDALMGGDALRSPLRSDVAVTVFLADPESYAGGELVIEDPAGEQAFRLGAGDAIAYPATSLHRVACVTSGERRVAVTWVQSLVRDAAQREILFDLDTARRQVFDREGKSGTFDLLAKSHANLLRRWAEP